MTINTQQVASIVRQVAAYAGIVMAALTQALGSIKLSPVASAIMGALGVLILGIEHYVADPSTGSTPVVVAPQVTHTQVVPAPMAGGQVPVPQQVNPAPPFPSNG